MKVRVTSSMVIVLFFVCLLVSGYGQSTSLQKPNIIVILPDDLGWSDVGYHGSDIKTPHIDHLARTGIQFGKHYVMTTCTPTRLALLTGKYPSRFGVLGPDYGEVIDLGHPTLASILLKQGYRTSIVGKWHLGSPPYTPLKYGFQSSYGYLDGQIDPYTHEYKKETALTDRQSWHRNDVYLQEEGHATDLITAEAVRVISQSDDAPFFLYLAYSVPHYPLKEPVEWLEYYKNMGWFPSRQWFAASVSHMDDGIGQVIQALEANGKRENTVILFLSDNGGQHSWASDTEYQGQYNDLPHTVLGNNFPLRGWKGDLYEGGIRVPAFINWPKKLDPGVADFPVHVADWLPSFCDLLNLSDESLPNDWDGINIWSYLTNPSSESFPDRTMYWKTRKEYAVQYGPWKLLTDQKLGSLELYNLDLDFRETKNLIDKQPNIATSMLERLEALRLGDR